ncbi:glutathione S-transferase family protein [Dickeya dadantii]|uniref:glutathione S-transferase family protein n=1 Tax=Dickeya dadantii TaxID=204038 RepID=UPI00149586CB|nr:glutathione S-transferase family protein [Dickeya dadantii]NPE51471.1 glutathione S-transferase family protein [Dickeya dadantii]
MSQSQLTLISHHLCPFVQRVAIVLLEKGIPFQRINVDLQNKPDWFFAISPTGKVPLLKVPDSHGGESVLFESIAICEYLEDVYPEPALHLMNALLRAQHRAWIEFVSATLSDAWGFLNASDPRTALAKSAALRGKLERFNAEISDGPYFAGEELSMVDIAIAPVFRYFDILNVESSHPVFDGLNRVADWRRALAKRPSIQTAVAGDYATRFHKHLQEARALLADLLPID